MKLFDEDDPRLAMMTLTRERLSAARRRENVIAAVRDHARAICQSDGITLVLRDGEQCHYVEEDAIGPLWKGQKFPINSCISGWSMLNASTAVIGDITQDARIPQDAYRPTFVRSLIMTPVGDRNVAAMGAYWKDIRSFTDMEIMTVKTFASIVGRTLSDLLNGPDPLRQAR